MTQANDIVLIYLEDNPIGFARVEDISPDIKKDWYHIKLLMLQIPLQNITWILKGDYIEGAEFTMSGNRMRLEKVVAPEEPGKTDPGEMPEEEKEKPSKPGKVISFKKKKKNNNL
ncbi:MAG: hypothetical protein JRI61_08845 [Deltaproteobacteria bacterium]|nr:hypothetical protein [Deltaproteobacteria bacterium]